MQVELRSSIHDKGRCHFYLFAMRQGLIWLADVVFGSVEDIDMANVIVLLILMAGIVILICSLPGGW